MERVGRFVSRLSAKMLSGMALVGGALSAPPALCLLTAAAPLQARPLPLSPPCPTILRRLTFPAYTPGGRPLESVDLLLICDSYLGLDQQYTIPLGGSSAAGGSAAGALPLVGQAARRARRQEQQDARRQHAADGQQQQGGQELGAGAPMDMDVPQDQPQQTLQQQQQQAAAGAGAGEVLPQRAPRRQRGGAARQLDRMEPTLDCRLDQHDGS